MTWLDGWLAPVAKSSNNKREEQRGDTQARHYHERRYGTHGAEPTPRALDPGDPRSGRRHAAERGPRDARSDPGRPQRGEGRGAWKAIRHRANHDRPHLRAEEPG